MSAEFTFIVSWNMPKSYQPQETQLNIQSQTKWMVSQLYSCNKESTNFLDSFCLLLTFKDCTL